MPESLENIQRIFGDALADARHDRDLMATLDVADARTVERIGIYRGNLNAVWQRALGDAYPVVNALVGNEFFHALARAYGRATPSQSGDLNEFGVGFARFLSTFPPAQALPYVVDMARLEWLLHQSHYAADGVGLEPSQIAALSPPQLLASHFLLHPAVVWLSSRFPIASLWLAHQAPPDGMLPDTLQRAETALVVRPRWRARVLRSSSAEVAALASLRRGADMATAIETALASDPDFDGSATLLRWIDHQILVGSPAG
jgi:hypothetical protein